MPQVPLIPTTAQSRSLPLDAQRCINFFAEAAQKDAESPVGVFGCPGLTQFARINAGPVRGFRLVNNVLYVVSGSKFFSLAANGAFTDLTSGLTISGSSPVGISDNGIQVMIVNGARGYCYGIPGTSAPNAGAMTDVTGASGFYPANTVTFIDGYFVFDRAGTTQFFLSGLFDGTSFSGLDFASEEQISDIVQCAINLKDQLLIVGQKTISIWYDTGANNFPFQPYSGSLVMRGTCAPLSITYEDNSIFFMGDDGIFYRLNGYLPVRISTPTVESLWGSYYKISDCYCFVVSWQGHKFINVVFPGQPATWVFDLQTGLWHERESWDSGNNSLGRWRGNCAIRAFDKVLVGDAFDGVVGVYDDNAYTEYGNTIRGLITTPPIHKDRKRIFMSRFELYMESGVGLPSGQGSNPQIVLDWSDDGARTWSRQQTPASFGAEGQYRQRTRWLRLGQSRTRTYRLTVTDPVRRNIVGAYVDMAAGL